MKSGGRWPPAFRTSAMNTGSAAPFAERNVNVSLLSDGGFLLRSPQQLGSHARCMNDYLQHWATHAPDRCFLAQRQADDAWRRVSYREALSKVMSIAAALLAHGISPHRPIAILSENSIEHALLVLAAMHVGIPVAPISPAYSLLSKDFARLRQIVSLIEPGLIFVQNHAQFASALGAVANAASECVVVAGEATGRRVTAFDALTTSAAGAEVAAANAKVGPDTVAKILFTSGSTGSPKGVINTQRMMCANQQAITQLWPFLLDCPPIVVDWLPWSHTFGANHNFNLVLRHGGSMYIDEGKPTPALIDRTVANLREISPTLYFNVPRGYEMLLPQLEGSAALAMNFFSRLTVLFYAAASLTRDVWDRIDRLARRTRGKPVMMISAWGATETGPMATTVHYSVDRPGIVGLPGPGTEIKLVPNSGKLELRVRGPNVTPGYFKQPSLSASAFDDQGFCRTGDAGRLADHRDPSLGIEFDGRLAEDFKLSTGTWVSVANVRQRVLDIGSLVVQDCVVTGHDRSEIGILLVPNWPGCLRLCPDIPPSQTHPELLQRAEVRSAVRELLMRLADASDGSSTRPTRAILLSDPLDIDASEITDKGYVNQRAVLLHRAALVDRLHASSPGAEVITTD